LKVLVSDSLSKEGLEILQKNVEVDYKPEISPDQLLTDIDNYDALVVRSRSKVNAAVIEAGTKLKVIGRAGVGVDNIDVEKATEKGIIVLNAPHGNTVSAAEHAIAMLTTLARNIVGANICMFEQLVLVGKVFTTSFTVILILSSISQFLL